MPEPGRPGRSVFRSGRASPERAMGHRRANSITPVTMTRVAVGLADVSSGVDGMASAQSRQKISVSTASGPRIQCVS